MTILSSLRYLYLKTLVTIFRLLLRALKKTPPPTPDSVLYIPSRDANRSIKVHLYKPKPKQNQEQELPDLAPADSTTATTASTAATPQYQNTTTTTTSTTTTRSQQKSESESESWQPTPVLISLHGSSLSFPLHGTDDLFCHHITKHTPYTVLDVSYRLAPEYPFPAAMHDVVDVVRYIRSCPELYRADRVSICGFSAGGSIALGLATAGDCEAAGFKSVITFYPATDLYRDPSERVPFSKSHCGAKKRPAFVTRILREGYIGDKDARDPRISPSFAGVRELRGFKPSLVLFTGELDESAREAEEFAGRVGDAIGSASGERDGRVIVKRMEGCGHGFDKGVDCGDVRARDEAYGVVVRVLNEVL